MKKYHILILKAPGRRNRTDWDIKLYEDLRIEDMGATVELVTPKTVHQLEKSDQWALYYFDGQTCQEIYRFRTDHIECLKGVK